MFRGFREKKRSAAKYPWLYGPFLIWAFEWNWWNFYRCSVETNSVFSCIFFWYHQRNHWDNQIKKIKRNESLTCSTTKHLCKLSKIYIFFFFFMLLPLTGRSFFKIYLLFRFHFSYVLCCVLRVKYNNIIFFLTPTFSTRWRRPFNQTFIRTIFLRRIASFLKRLPVLLLLLAAPARPLVLFLPAHHS